MQLLVIYTTFFANHVLGETEVRLNMDNCCGQNKNSFILYGTLLGE